MREKVTTLNRPVNSRRLESTVKAIAVTAGIVYVIGFVVVVFHDSRFGIAIFDLFKPRAISAGILFVLLAAVPSGSALQVIGRQLAHPVDGTRRGWLTLMGATASLVPGSVTLALIFGFFVHADLFSMKKWPVLVVSVGNLVVLMIARQNKWFSRFPRSAVFGQCIVSSMFVPAIAISTKERSLEHLGLWFFAVGVVTLIAQARLNEGFTWRWDELGEWAVIGIALLLSFSVYVYGLSLIHI